MLKKEIWRQLAPVLVFLALVSIIHWPLKFSLIFFCLGAVIGTFLLHLDQVIYCFFQSPHEFSSQRIKRLWEQKDYRGAIVLLLETQEERGKLVFHSVLFQAILVAACFFVLSSSASLLGKGLVMGIFSQTLVEQGRELRRKNQMDNWFWQFKSLPGLPIQAIYWAVIFLLFIAFTLFWL